MEINKKEDLISFLTELKAQQDTMQETIDKLAPVEEEQKQEDKQEEKTDEEKPDEEKVDEVDKLLHED